MKTFEEQSAFFKSQWDAMRDAVESGGGPAVIEFIAGFEDDLEKRVLFIMARQGLVMQDWDGKSFDPYVEVCDAGIAEMLRQAEAAPDDETRRLRTNGAHIISFNLAADLAECWPGDDDPRTTAHFERGARAGRDCLGWCAPENLHGISADHWVLGMHLLSLGDPGAAEASFRKAFDVACAQARASGAPDTVSGDGEFAVILYTGYLGIAESLAGRAAGGSRYDRAVAAFRDQMANEDTKEDAEFGIAQLEKVRTQLL